MTHRTIYTLSSARDGFQRSWTTQSTVQQGCWAEAFDGLKPDELEAITSGSPDYYHLGWQSWKDGSLVEADCRHAYYVCEEQIREKKLAMIEDRALAKKGLI